MKKGARFFALVIFLALQWKVGLAHPEADPPVSSTPEVLDTPIEPQSSLITDPIQETNVQPTQPDPNHYQLHPNRQIQRGIGSWYGPGFHGRRTASGQLFNMHALTAAHKTLPLMSYVKVTLADTGHFVIAQITDRGPFVKGRIIDLSKGAAAALGLLPKGLATVTVEPIMLISKLK